jgi:hypothetical protein
MNMDYSFSEALKHSNMGDISRLIAMYDVMCQYWTNLERRFDESPFLSFPTAMNILRGIGLFHVHGHQDRCFPRFAPTFIEGAGMVDGEILETLWAVLNEIARSTRGATLAYRTELLNNHMNDSNWKKLIGMGISLSSFSAFPQSLTISHTVVTLCRKYAKAKIGVRQSRADLDGLIKTADPNRVAEWTTQAVEAAENRNTREDSMDIYELKFVKRSYHFPYKNKTRN